MWGERGASEAKGGPRASPAISACGAGMWARRPASQGNGIEGTQTRNFFSSGFGIDARLLACSHDTRTRAVEAQECVVGSGVPATQLGTETHRPATGQTLPLRNCGCLRLTLTLTW